MGVSSVDCNADGRYLNCSFGKKSGDGRTPGRCFIFFTRARQNASVEESYKFCNPFNRKCHWVTGPLNSRHPSSRQT